jgi:hypothetical protein
MALMPFSWSWRRRRGYVWIGNTGSAVAGDYIRHAFLDGQAWAPSPSCITAHHGASSDARAIGGPKIEANAKPAAITASLMTVFHCSAYSSNLRFDLCRCETWTVFDSTISKKAAHADRPLTSGAICFIRQDFVVPRAAACACRRLTQTRQSRSPQLCCRSRRQCSSEVAQ